MIYDIIKKQESVKSSKLSFHFAWSKAAA